LVTLLVKLAPTGIEEALRAHPVLQLLRIVGHADKPPRMTNDFAPSPARYAKPRRGPNCFQLVYTMFLGIPRVSLAVMMLPPKPFDSVDNRGQRDLSLGPVHRTLVWCR
jgi:hypothetical protein